MSLPDERDIRQSLQLANDALEALDLFQSIDSTNAWLMQQTPPNVGHCHVAIADEQTAGRGRHGRQWHSPPGAGLWMSMAYSFAAKPENLPTLTLGIGAAVVEALRSVGFDSTALKWPNDLVAGDGKLGGILTEARSAGNAGISVVTGVGINVDMPDDIEIGGESDWAHRITDLRSMNADLPPRERLAAALIDALFATMRHFEAGDFSKFLNVWREADWLRGKPIVVDHNGSKVDGIAAGVDADGALLLNRGKETLRISSGSVVLAERSEAPA